jgi:hypothetical protein
MKLTGIFQPWLHGRSTDHTRKNKNHHSLQCLRHREFSTPPARHANLYRPAVIYPAQKTAD